MKKNLLALFTWTACLILSSCQEVAPPQAVGPCPNENQMRWQEMEYYAFIHFSINTFTDAEWGYGDASPALFNPSELDCEQWAETCKKAGMKGIILTAKHHDGFCLWPTETTDYSVKASPWRDGKGDLVRELSDACKKHGLKLGIYLSPWDRNNAAYGTPEYIDIYRKQLRELLTNYGDVFEVWFDGANGGDGYYGGLRGMREVDRKTYYDWPETHKIIRELQPNAVIFSDAGPDVRWCGNEEGWVGETNWSPLRRDEFWPGSPFYQQLLYGHEDGTHWVPAEVNVSIRPGWFYHASEDHQVKSLPELLDIYYHSIGRNGTLLVNFPVDRRGLIHETDREQVLALAEAVKADFANNLAKGAKASATEIRGNSRKYGANKVLDGNPETYWTTDDSIARAAITIDLGKPTDINRFLVQEYIRLGQRVKSFTVEALVDGAWQTLDSQTTVGYKRILRFPTVRASQVRFTVTDAKAAPLISNIALYHAPKVLTPPIIRRNQAGEVTILPADPESIIRYTTDGSEPTQKSPRYEAPFVFDQKGEIRAAAFDLLKHSPVSHETFDISRRNWKVVNSDDPDAKRIFDGDPNTSWHSRSKTGQIELIIDLNETHTLKGFRYLPQQDRWASGVIFNYRFSVSSDNNTWKTVSEGEFSNIRNNPVTQTQYFEPTAARFVKLTALKTDQAGIAGYAEFDVITE